MSKKPRTDAPATSVPGPLDAGLAALARGNHVEARARFEVAAKDADLPAGARGQAEALARATRLEPGAVRVGLASIGLLLLVLLVTVLRQP
jgi:hypothetical protein